MSLSGWILCSLWHLRVLGIACQVAITLSIFGASAPSRPLVGIEKTPTPAKDDLEQLQPLEDNIREGKFQEVEDLLRSYLKAHPGSARAYYDLGYVLFRTHQISASVQALAKSLQLDISNPEAHKVLGLDFTIIGKYDEAQIELEQAARLKPHSAEIHYFLGRIHYTRNAFPLAKKEFEEAIRLDPSYMKAYDNLGLTMEGMGDDRAALANYEKAFEVMKQQGLKSPWPYINACALSNRLNKPEQALEYCQKAIERNPQSDQGFFETGRAQMAQEKWDDAAKALERAIEINPRFAKFHYVLGTVYRKMGKRTESAREMAAYQKLSQQSGALSLPKTAEPPRPEPDNPAEVRH